MRIRALIGLLVLVMLAGALTARADDLARGLLEGLRLIPAGPAAPVLALKRLDDGRTVALPDFRGRPVLVYFWATW